MIVRNCVPEKGEEEREAFLRSLQTAAALNSQFSKVSSPLQKQMLGVSFPL
jgi:hypothetical protein